MQQLLMAQRCSPWFYSWIQCGGCLGSPPTACLLARVSRHLGWRSLSQPGFLLACLCPEHPDPHSIWPIRLSGETTEKKTHFFLLFSEEKQVWQVSPHPSAQKRKKNNRKRGWQWKGRKTAHFLASLKAGLLLTPGWIHLCWSRQEKDASAGLLLPWRPAETREAKDCQRRLLN